MRRWLGAAALALGLLPTPAPAGACALELILAVDVSGSIDAREFALQTNGLADAFENPSLVAAISELEGGMLVTARRLRGCRSAPQRLPRTGQGPTLCWPTTS